MLAAIETQTNATKKKSKKKNKSKLTYKSECETNSNSDSHAVINQLAADNDEHHADDDGGVGGVNEREMQLVSEELLKRLQINGTCGASSDIGVSHGVSHGAMDGGENEVNSINVNGTQIAVNESDSAKKLVAATNQHTINYHNNNNNNNNNCKKTSNQVTTKCETQATLCNGAKHKTYAQDVADDDGSTMARTNCDKQPQSIANKSSIAQRSLPNTNATELSKQCTQSNAETTKSPTATTPIDKPNMSADVTAAVTSGPSNIIEIAYKEYESELQMPDIMRVIQRELSEPYSIYTYRYFIHNWPKLCFLAMHDNHCVGAIVCKLDIHRQQIKRGYIAMLAVEQDYRKLKVGTTLVQKAIEVTTLNYTHISRFHSFIVSHPNHDFNDSRQCWHTMLMKWSLKQKSPIYLHYGYMNDWVLYVINDCSIII